MTDHHMAELEESDSRNVINMVSKTIREAVIDTYSKNPKYQTMSEQELENAVHPSINASLIRVAFWEEYNRAQDLNKNMVMAKIYNGVMDKVSFYEFITHHKNIAWMMCPPADEFLQMKADSYKARREYSKILRTPLFDKDGKFKYREFQASIKIYELYNNRIHGSVIHRVEQKTATLHLHKPENDIGGDPEELRKELEELRANSPNKIIEIEGKEE